MEDFLLIEKVGEGTYGVVYKGQNKYTGQLVALKKIRPDEYEEGIPATAIREISLLKELRHPNIVRLEDVFYENSAIYLIFEFMDMDLKRYMNFLGPGNFLAPNIVKSYLYQINSAILFCHQRRVIHRDLKPENLLIDKTGIIKVGDFGLGRTYSVYKQAWTHEVVTLWYRAPELLLGERWYYSPIDIWAMGCIFAEMVSKEALFQGHSEIDQLYRMFRVLGTPSEKTWPGVSRLPDYKTTFPSWPADSLRDQVKKVSEDGVDLLFKMLWYDPSKRISAKGVSLHAYFKDVQLPLGLQCAVPHAENNI